jgi:hypothetical protein
MKKFVVNFLGIAIILASSFGLSLQYPGQAKALNNSLVILDSIYTDSGSMSAADINNFLCGKGSRYCNYTIPEYIDVPYPTSGGLQSVSARQYQDSNGAVFYGKTVAQLIYDESREHGVSPRVILATLQKESSAVSGDVFRSSTVAAWPMFYYYTEGMANCFYSGTNCDDATYRQRAIDYGGVGQQIAYATWFFGYYYSYYGSSYSSPISIDGQSVSCQSRGTRVLYRYTPHVQTSFYNIFSEWFGAPDGGQAYTAPTASTPTVQIYRFWSSRFNKHFFTADTGERDALIANDPNWNYEGVMGNAYDCSLAGAPVYRFWSPNFNNAHFYTTSVTEKDRLITSDPNWRYENIAYCTAGDSQVYRFWSSRFASHFFTTNPAERDQLISSDPNWNYEGVAFNIH